MRGGVGYLYSPHLIATVRQSAANPFIPFRIVYNRTEATGEERQVADVHRRHGGDRAARRGRPADGLLGIRPRHAGALHDPVDAQRAAFAGPHDGGGSRLHPHRRQRLPAAAAVHAGVRQADRRAAESGARRARRLLRRQQPDDGLQRPADVAAQAVLEPLFVGS